MTWGPPGRSSSRLRADPPCAAARQYAAGPRPERVRFAEGIAVEPCFNLDKRDERSFRGSVSGMGFAYCDFRHQGAKQMLMARAVGCARCIPPDRRARPMPRTPKFPRGWIACGRELRLEPVKSVEPARTESAPELRRSTDYEISHCSAHRSERVSLEVSISGSDGDLPYLGPANSCVGSDWRSNLGGLTGGRSNT